MNIEPIAHFRSPFESKFGIPKQSGIISNLKGSIVMEGKYRNVNYIRGLEGFDYIWLLWGFSANKQSACSPLVRPPRLGGNKKMGVFATRSPFRPNSIGLSSVKIERIEIDSNTGPVIHVLGADLMDGTPIYDIKPYLEYADAHTNIRNGFVDTTKWEKLEVEIPEELARTFAKEDLETLCEVLRNDPRPQYQNDETRVYGMPFMGKDIHFTVKNNILQVII